MTREEIMSLPHLAKVEVKRLMHLHTEDGYYICNEPEDMHNFWYTNCLRCELKDKYEDCKVVSEAEILEIISTLKYDVNEEDVEVALGIASGATAE